MPCVGFEPMIPTRERTKTIYALDRAATVNGIPSGRVHKLSQKSVKCPENCTLNSPEIAFSITQFTKIIRSEVLHVQRTTHNAVIPFYKLTGRFESERSR
jgi:hypothetical protein